MGILKNIASGGKKIFEKIGTGLQAVGNNTTVPILKSFLAPVSMISTGVKQMQGDRTKNPFEKYATGNALSGSKEESGTILKNAAALGTLVNPSNALGRVGVSTAIGIMSGAGSAAEAGKSNKDIFKTGVIDGALSATLSIATEGISALLRSRAARRMANEKFLNALPPDTKTRQKEFENQFRENITRFGEKVQREYGADTLNGYIKQSDNNIIKWGELYRNRLKTAYSDAIIYTDDIVNNYTDDFVKSNLGKMTEKESGMLSNMVSEYKLSGANSPEKILDIRQQIDSDIPSSAWKSWKGGEPVAEKVEARIMFRNTLNSMLEKLNPDDQVLQIAGKKMSLAYEVRRLAAIQKDIISIGKKAGTTEAMSTLDKVLANTFQSTKIRTTIGSGIMNLQNLTKPGGFKKNFTTQNIIKAVFDKKAPDPIKDYGFEPKTDKIDLTQFGWEPIK